MEATIREGHAPAVVISLEPGETLKTEAGAMMFVSGDIISGVEIPGGMTGGLKRKMFAGESIFLATYMARGAGVVGVCGPVPGIDPAGRAGRRADLREARLPRPCRRGRRSST